MEFRQTILSGLSAMILLSALGRADAREPVIPDVDYYDCSGDKLNTLHVHPWDCTRFIHCDNGRAHDKSCAVCHVDAKTCPTGWLVFDYKQQQCDWADKAEANCAVKEPEPHE